MPPEDDFERLIAESLGLGDRAAEARYLAIVERVFLSQHYQQRTDAQSAAIPAVLRGNDVLLVAPTASGKTEAALIPIATKFLAEKSEGLCVYVAPTRALLNDIVARVGPSLERLHLMYAVR
ncbi:MAG: DEAD/DEAH box helicase, partial [Bacillota bacterium]|nr:DEAD/DEAH box helicase [Bacillota bacterium]